MQQSSLTNYCLLYLTLQSSECFKILSALSTMNVVKIPSKQLDFYQYQAKKDMKSMRQKDKNVKTEFQVIIVKDEDINFMFNRQKSSMADNKGHMAISNRNFFDIMIRNKLLGQVSLQRNIKIIVESFMWENYIISHSEVVKGKSLLMIQQIFSSTVFKTANSEQYQIHKKTKLIFQPILDLLFTPPKTASILLNFQKQLRSLRQIYPQVGGRDSNIELNYCLIYYYAVSQAIKQN